MAIPSTLRPQLAGLRIAPLGGMSKKKFGAINSARNKMAI